MKHLDEAQLADFVRNLAPQGDLSAMQRHINSGCKDCEVQLNMWQTIASLAKAEAGFTPSEDAVRIAKSAFVLVPELPITVRLVFDSLMQPALAGTRGAVTARQFLFETDELYIDLRLDAQAERLSLVGQIVDRLQTKQAVQDLPIHLHKGKRRLAHTKTNQFGEFQFEFEASPDLSISIALKQRNPIFLPLYGIDSKPLNPSGTA